MYSIIKKQKNVKQADFVNILSAKKYIFSDIQKTLSFSEKKQYNASRKKIVLPARKIQPDERIIADTIYSVLQNLAYYLKPPTTKVAGFPSEKTGLQTSSLQDHSH